MFVMLRFVVFVLLLVAVGAALPEDRAWWLDLAVALPFYIGFVILLNLWQRRR